MAGAILEAPKTESSGKQYGAADASTIKSSLASKSSDVESDATPAAGVPAKSWCGGVPLKVGASVALTLFVVLQTNLTRASRDSEGNLPYIASTSIMLTELIKLTVATSVWYMNMNTGDNGLDGFTWRRFFLFGLPGLSYAFQNNMVYFALVYLDPPTFQVFASFKIITNGIMSRVIMKRTLSEVQWAALFQLMVSMVICKLNELSHDSGATSSAGSARLTVLIGGSIMLLNSCMSAFSNVFNEYLIKKENPDAPLMFKNMQLYFWGVLINVPIALFEAQHMNKSLTSGMDSMMPWAVLCTNALVGLSVSLVMKHADTIVMCFSTAAAVLLSSVVSVVLFNFSLSLAFMMGVAIYTSAFYLYFGDHNTKLKKLYEAEQKAATE